MKKQFVDKVIGMIEKFDSTGFDNNRVYVREGVELFMKGEKDAALASFRESGLSKEGVLYFTVREYLGSEKQEEEVLAFILDKL